MKEADALSEKLKKYEKTQIQKYTYYPIHMLMLDEGIIGTDEKYGAMMVRSPINYKRMLDTHDLMQWKQQKDEESLFQAFPEEREAKKERIAAIVQQVRTIVQGISTKMPKIGASVKV